MPRLQPLDSNNLADKIADQLRETIQSGEYAPGERLVERRLAGELNVSHIPVREALARLTEEGLVERLPRRGARVAVIGLKELEELSSLRVVLEQFVVDRVMQRWTPEAEQALRQTVAQMEQAARRRDTRRIFDLDVRFHEQLWVLADHGILADFAAQLRGRINGFLRAATTALEATALQEHARSHAQLLDATASGNAAAARKAMAKHIELAADRIATRLIAEEAARPPAG